MGKYDSSIYRVRPLMDIIKNDFDAYKKVLSLVKIKNFEDVENIGRPLEYCYDSGDEACKEKQLKPTKDHLRKLIEYIAEKDFGDAVIKNAKRRDLCIPDKENQKSRQRACEDAIKELNKNYDNLSPTSRAWYVFEGFTNPDIFIEAEDYIIVCEGKWTEPKITTHTTNLNGKDEHRNQMIRHIQAALNHKDKKVYAFYIVDEGCGYEETLKIEKFPKLVDGEKIQINSPEREKIIEAYKGYITWQQIKEIIPNVEFKTKREIDNAT